MSVHIRSLYRRRVAGERLAPLIQNDVPVSQRTMDGLQAFRCGDDASGGKVASRIVLLANDNDARMMTTGLHDQIMKQREVVVIRRH